MQTAALGMSVLGGAMSIGQGFAQAGAYKSQAAQYQQQARFAALQAKTDEANRLDQLNQAIGASRAMMAAGNVDVYSSGSMEALNNANRDIVTRSITYEEAGSLAQQQRLAAASASASAAAPWAIMGGLMQAGGSIFQGVDKYQQTSIPGGSAF
jgi:hypothetical protein